MFYKYYLDDEEFSTYSDLRKAVKDMFPTVSFPQDEDKFLAVEWDKLGVKVRREEYTQPEPSIETMKANKKTELRQARYQEEIGGYQYGAYSIATDDNSKLLLLSNVVAANSAEEYSVDVKCVDGEYITVNKQELLALYSAIMVWLNGLSTKEKTLFAQVDSATTKEEIEAIGWDDETVTD